MKLDRIDVELVRDTYEYDGKTYPNEYIALLINGKRIEGIFDVLEFAVPRIKNANWFIMTCSCGIAGCAGYFEGINVKRRASAVEWRDMEHKKNTFSKPFHAFNRAEYEAAQEKGLDLLYALVREREAQPPVDDVDYKLQDNIIRWDSVEALDKSVARYSDFIEKHRQSWSW